MKICTIVGARPQFIKAAAFSRVAAMRPNIQEIIIHTGQHYDANMSSQFFEELNIPNPQYNLNIGSGSHGAQTGQMLAAIEGLLIQEKPDWVLVYGDTNSTLAGALAAVKLHIPIAHVEAGLRSFNKKMPEEINRIATDHVSNLLLVPTENAYEQLKKEGIDPAQISNVGDVMFDATLYYNEFNSTRKTLVDTLDLKEKSYILATIHRAENTDDPNRLQNICNALLELSTEYTVVLPLHPRTKQVLEKLHKLAPMQSALKLIDPVGYLDMLALEKHAKAIITDSGGVQKEAFFNKVPCITLRNETEWVELVQSGWNTLCPPDNAFSLLPLLSTVPDIHKKTPAFYGNGEASQNILNRLLNTL